MDNKKQNKGKNGFWREFITLLPFLVAIALVVLSLPKQSSTYKFQFEIGKPWQYDLLTATYDFPIYKSQEQIKQERDEILNRHVPIFDTDSNVKSKSLQAVTELKKEHNQAVTLENGHTIHVNLKPYAEYLASQLEKIYNSGIVSDDVYSDCVNKGTTYITVTANNLSRNRNFSDIYSESSAKARIISEIPGKLQADVLTQIGLEKLIEPNLIYNNELTTKVKTEDLNNISMTSGMVQAGERIIDTGEIVTEQKFNILDSMRREALMQEEITFNQRNTLLAGQILLVTCLFTLLYFYLRMFRRSSLRNWRYVVMLLSYMVIFLAISNAVGRIGENFYFYAIPYTLLPIIVSIFGENKIDTRTGLFAHIITILIASFQVPMPYTFVLLEISAGMVAINSIKDFSQRSQFVRTAGIILVSYFVIYFGYVLIVYNSFTMFEWNNFFALAANGIMLMLAYPLIFLTEKLFKFTSNVTLLELTNTNNTVLRELSEKAPGTFQHSMQVSNLAAEVAETIGANPLLTRTGALYHDIGKMNNPAYFTENSKNDNLHSKLTPEQSAQIIIKHVSDGVALAKQHQLPDKVIAFIKTHHGTSVTKFFYNTWANNHPGETPDLAAFSYPGPNPYTKEQGIVLICDGVEAASRSLNEYTEENIDNLVDKLVNGMVAAHYLDDAPITLKELNTIKVVLKERLHSIYHTRISYPELNNPPKEESARQENGDGNNTIKTENVLSEAESTETQSKTNDTENINNNNNSNDSQTTKNNEQ